MRRPHPRFDSRRNAWVTNAGGRLKVLAKGPKDSDTEQAAWDAFYQHMATLGRPVANVEIPQRTIGEIADEFGDWMRQEVDAGRKQPSTLEYYRHHLQKFLDEVGGNREALSILSLELERYKTNWHSVQTVQRLYNWAVEMRLLAENPFKGIEAPAVGERERVLTRHEEVRLLRAADRSFRHFLWAMIHTIARPQEVRAFQWKHLTLEPVPMFQLKDYKAKRLRKKSKQKQTRKFPLDNFMLRLLARLAEAHEPDPDAFVFLNARGRPWTGNAVRCRMRRLREKVGLTADENGESVVTYTFRHTGGTRATVNGVPSKVLAELMGHTSTTTTERYQHPQVEHLHDAINKVNQRRA